MNEFITKIDYSNNRQIQQFQRTSTDLSGATVHGVSFSALTAGPDPNNSGITSTIVSIDFTYSGNTGTTNFTFADSIVDLGKPYISAVTNINSGNSQTIGPIFTASSTSVIDGNTVNTTYSGISYYLTVNTMTSGAGPTFTGSGYTTSVNLLSAGTLDYTGRTIWADIKGITRTEKLIISHLPVPGYIWTCNDMTGCGKWAPTSGAVVTGTIWYSGNGANSAKLDNTNGIADGMFSVSEGNSTTAISNYSHAEGYLTTASGQSSHAEGNNTVSNGESSHAEGSGTSARGQASHAEGDKTIAIGDHAHSEGGNTIASGESSHSEGTNTTAKGQSSHAEGNYTIAIGDYSHASGYGTSSTKKVIANGISSFNHSYVTKVNLGALADYSGIFGGSDHIINTGATNSIILGGNDNVINANVLRSVIIGGSGMTATTSDTVYLPNLVVTGTSKSQALNISPTLTILSSATTITNSYGFYWISGATPYNITLPLAASYPDLEIQFKNIGSVNITLVRAGSELIDGATSKLITSLESYKIKSNGTNWYLI